MVYHSLVAMLKKVGYPLVTASLMFALVTSMLGAVLDHHSAERQPDHVHIYLGPATPDHTHPYETDHTHSHGQDTVDPTDSAPNDTVYITSHDGSGHSLVSLTAPTSHDVTVFPGSQDNQLLLGLAGKDIVSPEAFVSPPKRPPRA